MFRLSDFAALFITTLVCVVFIPSVMTNSIVSLDVLPVKGPQGPAMRVTEPSLKVPHGFSQWLYSILAVCPLDDMKTNFPGVNIVSDLRCHFPHRLQSYHTDRLSPGPSIQNNLCSQLLLSVSGIMIPNNTLQLLST